MASSVQRTVLSPGSDEYQEVLALFDSHSRGMEVESIEKVENSDLEWRFHRKEQEYMRNHGHVRTVQLWHGTKEENVSSILENNYDVSRHGQGVGHRFGAGVSFSSQASYASHYCDDNPTDTMLLNKVLVSNIVEVPENRGGEVLTKPPFIPDHYPPLRYDTTAKNKDIMDVIVKFGDDEYLPTHVVKFRR